MIVLQMRASVVQAYPGLRGAGLQRRAILPDRHLIGRLRGHSCHAAARECLSLFLCLPQMHFAVWRQRACQIPLRTLRALL